MQVSLDIETEARLAFLPALLLQPLVENSIRHGVEKKEGVGTINIRAKVGAGRLMIEVMDNGPGLTTESPVEGVGLSNIRARLQQLYPDDFAFQLVDGMGCGTVANLSLPLRNQEVITDSIKGTES